MMLMMRMMKIHVLPVLEDNYAFVVEAGSSAMVIDPSEAQPVINLLHARQLQLTHILLTHYHGDHTGGVDALKRVSGADVFGPDAASTPPAGVEVIDTPGHAFPHVAFYFREPGWLFSGDCLFGAGCGRLAGDAAATMWASLQKLAALPDATRVFFGHEYTLDNLAFAAAVEPDNQAIAARRERVVAALNSVGYSVPSTIEEEKATNPFLRAGNVEKFAQLRRKKNSFVA